MKTFDFLTLFITITLGFFSCDKKTPIKPNAPDPIVFVYHLTYDTTYGMSITGEWSAGNGKVIDSFINVSEGTNDSLIINKQKYWYSSDMDMYIGSTPRTTVKLWGEHKEHIKIIYSSGIGYQLFRSFSGEKM